VFVMAEPLPIVLIPGLNCSARLYAEQIPALWRFGPIEIADHTRDASMDAIAARILRDAPPRFALAGLSMGGYLALTIMRQAPERVQKLALLDTSARPETPEQSARRKPQIALTESGRFAEVPALQFPFFVHSSRQGDEALLAPAAGDHDAARCAAAVGGDQMSDVGARRRRRCADPAGALARDRRRDRGIAARHRCRLRTPFDHGAAGGGQ
jgi:pimeloyl-ACP methyl ester carboxylesterase